MSYFPFMAELEGKRCLIAGGGRTACRKVKTMLPFGAELWLTAKDILPELWELSRKHPQIVLRRKEIEPADLEGADLVIAATDSGSKNHEIAVWCRQRKIPVNTVDRKEDCDFIFPAIVQKGDILAAVSTGGKSPAAASYLKDRIDACIPEYFARIAETLGNCRKDIQARIPEEKNRRELFYRLIAYGAEHNGEIPQTVITGLLDSYPVSRMKKGKAEAGQHKNGRNEDQDRNKRERLSADTDETCGAGIKKAPSRT